MERMVLVQWRYGNGVWVRERWREISGAECAEQRGIRRPAAHQLHSEVMETRLSGEVKVLRMDRTGGQDGLEIKGETGLRWSEHVQRRDGECGGEE